VDKQGVDLLMTYEEATYEATTDRENAAFDADKMVFHEKASTRLPYCNAGACEAMYATCKKEAEDAFETGIMPAKLECRSLSPKNPHDH
jgi:hypothetical protein